MKRSLVSFVACGLLIGIIAFTSTDASAQSWQDQVYGKKAEAPITLSWSAELCSRLQSFYGFLKPAMEIKSEAPDLARGLLKIFGQPNEDRTKAESCQYWGTRSLDFTNGPQLMSITVDVMNRGELIPEHLNKTGMELRAIVVKDLTLQVQEARKQGGGAWIPGSRISKAVKLGYDKFNIDLDGELGLNKAEIALVRLKN